MTEQAAAVEKRSRWAILAHPEDIHCVIFHLLTLAAYGCAFWLYLHPDLIHVSDIWSRLAFVCAASIMLGWISAIDLGINFHNHTHRKIFRAEWLNRWFGRLWTFSAGWPSFYWWHAHVIVHHKNLLGPTDWTLPKRRADGSFENMFWYGPAHWPWRTSVDLWRDFSSGRGQAGVKRRAVVELLIFLALWSIPFWIDPWMALGLWVLPQWFANAWNMAPGMYVQHVGCIPKSDGHPVSHSNTFLSGFFNMTSFNIGYHIEHHNYPAVHWSELPALHEKLKEELIENNAHVLPFGYYRAGWFGSVMDVTRNEAQTDVEYAVQHPEYEKV
jgi:fatty acid desaturase